jgi:hypothetical protein
MGGAYIAFFPMCAVKSRFALISSRAVSHRRGRTHAMSACVRHPAIQIRPYLVHPLMVPACEPLGHCRPPGLLQG